jgi:hypothetical protein
LQTVLLKDVAIRRFYLMLDPNEKYTFDERAAILEYDGRNTREQSEYKVFIEVLKKRRAKYEATM